MAIRSEFATVELPIPLRDRLADMRIHPRQAMYEIIENALDFWDDHESMVRPRRGQDPPQTITKPQSPPLA
jgi:hypothetical protein